MARGRALADGPWWRSTALHREMAYVGGTLYASGGVLVLLTLLPPWDLYARELVAAIGAVAVVVGGFYLWSAERLPMPLWQYAIATSIGAVLVTLAVIGGGPETTATYGVLYVFVSTYGFYYYPWPLAWWFVALDGVGFALALGWHDVDAAVMQWVMIVGVSVIAGGLIGSLGRRVRRLLDVEQATVADLSERDAWKTTFLRAVAHDVRTPLASMLGMLMLLRDHGQEVPAQQRDELVGRAVDAGERLARMVSDLLDLERIEAGGIEPRREPVRLDELVRGCLEVADLTDRRLETDLAPVTVPVEPTKVERIVENLVGNAGRHTPRGARVWVRVHEDGDAAVLVVEDDGQGLPVELRDGVPAAGSAAVAPHRGRVGLGLHLVRRFAEFHGGTVVASERPGGGARFEVRLPLAPP